MPKHDAYCKDTEHREADEAAYRDALDAVVNRGCPREAVVRTLRRVYAANFRQFDPNNWRRTQKGAQS